MQKREAIRILWSRHSHHSTPLRPLSTAMYGSFSFVSLVEHEYRALGCSGYVGPYWAQWAQRRPIYGPMMGPTSAQTWTHHRQGPEIDPTWAQYWPIHVPIMAHIGPILSPSWAHMWAHYGPISGPIVCCTQGSSDKQANETQPYEFVSSRRVLQL
jgi:hypothetical protein